MLKDIGAELPHELAVLVEYLNLRNTIEGTCSRREQTKPGVLEIALSPRYRHWMPLQPHGWDTKVGRRAFQPMK